MIIHEATRNVIERQLLDFKKGHMIADKYKAKFRKLSYFVVDLDITNEIQKCDMLENLLRDEIKTPMFVGLFLDYNSCIGSTGTI